MIVSVFANIFKIKNAQKIVKNNLAPTAPKISDVSNCRCKEIMRVFLLGFFSLLAFAWIHENILWNHTWSMPVGLYIKENKPVKVGSVVEACAPKWLVAMGYAISSSRCHGGSLILKHVGALPGQRISVFVKNAKKTVFIDGKDTGATILSSDSHGRSLPSFSGGVVPPGHVFLFSTFSKRSADSRYFGWVPTKDILGVYTCLVCFNK